MGKRVQRVSGPDRKNRPGAIERRRPASNVELPRRLLAHYDASRRELPWRQDRDPYRVWVSEVMLQQTRIETVIPYYRRWLERFPDLRSLAEAPEDAVLKQWEGLGYYSRARNLHRTARIVRERYDGELPPDPDRLRELPGFGEYTVGAVASIAFGRRLPAVDGNVRRVLARLFDKATVSPAWFRRTAETLVPADRPGDFNQSLMELGATICTPRAPRCANCPLADRCLARERGTVARRPARRRRAAVPTVELATAVVRDDAGRLLLVRNATDGLLAGLWSFPAVEPAPGEAPPAAAARVARAAGAVVEAASGRELQSVPHAFTHLRAVYRTFTFVLHGAHAAGADVLWADGAALERLALPVAQRKIARLAAQ